MNLRLSEDEFATLIDMVSLAAEVSSLNQKPDSEAGFQAFSILEDKILARASVEGFDEIVEIDPDTRKHRITADYQEGSYVQDCIEEMRNEVFWEELSFRLSERDFIKVTGESNYLSMTEGDRIAAITSGKKRYWEKFANTGLSCLHFVAPHEEG